MDGLVKRSGSDQIDIAVFQRYRCPAEILIPYRIRKVPSNAIGTWWNTIFQKPRAVTLWNMDFPWLLVIGTTLVGTASAAIALSLLRWLTNGSGAFAILVAVMGFFPIVFALLGMSLYPFFVTVNMRLGWGKSWLHTLLGPTHIGITDSGFKLYVRGWFFYNYPNLALWQEIFKADLVADAEKNSTVLRFTYQTGFGRAPIDLPLDAFETIEDLHFVLRTFAENVPEQVQGSFLRAMVALEFKPILEAYEQGQLLAVGFEQTRLLEVKALGMD
jgi:hypothetical protein